MPDASFGTVFKSFRFHLSTLQTERFQTAPLSSFDKEKQTKSVSPDSWAKYQFIFLIDIVLGVALVRGYLNSIFFRDLSSLHEQRSNMYLKNYNGCLVTGGLADEGFSYLCRRNKYVE